MSQEESSFQRNHLLPAVILTVLLVVAISLFLVRPSDSVSLPPSQLGVHQNHARSAPTRDAVDLSGTKTSNPRLTFVADVTDTPTPVNYPTPFKDSDGTNLPSGFQVVQWRDNNTSCDRNPKMKTVNIYGLIVSGGTYPYQLTFWRFGVVSAPNLVTPTTVPPPSTPDPNVPDGSIFIFDPPVELYRGKYYHVTLSFNWEKGNATWIDDLYYPPCSKN
jgi:hypothetical protein